MRRSDDAPVLRLVRVAVDGARTLNPCFGGDISPLAEGQLADLLRQAGCQVEAYRFRSRTGGFALGFQGRPGIAINQNATRPARVLATLHELAHVLLEDTGSTVAGPVCYRECGYMTPWERTADLFALVDLVPAWSLKPLRKQHDRALRKEVAGNIAEYADGWPMRRLADRARLRVQLYRQYGI